MSTTGYLIGNEWVRHGRARWAAAAAFSRACDLCADSRARCDCEKCDRDNSWLCVLCCAVVTRESRCSMCEVGFNHHGSGALCGNEERRGVDMSTFVDGCDVCSGRRYCAYCCKSVRAHAMVGRLVALLYETNRTAGQLRQLASMLLQGGSPDHLYFVESDCGRIKIGRSFDATKRLVDLQVGSPRKLRLRGVVRGCGDLEGKLHERFRDQRLHGEWFEPTPELLNAVDALIFGSAEVTRAHLEEFDQLINDPIMNYAERLLRFSA